MATAKNTKKQVMVQAGILAAASIIVRIIGLLYRSPLTAIIGDEGNGYYGTAYNIYTIILLISSYSVPSAVSKIMAQRMALGEYRNAQRIFRCALIYSLVVGMLASLFLFFGAGFLVSSNSVPVLRVFAPTVFLFGILGCLRGYFQANATMLQTSVSQILEQLLNAIISIFAAYYLMQMVAGQDSTTQAVYGAMGSALGTGSGVAIALLFMAWTYYINRGTIRSRIYHDRTKHLEPYSQIMKDTIMVVTPFILSGFILNLTTALNQTFYIHVLSDIRGFTQTDISTQYGIFSGKAVVITNIPISIATAVAAAIIPTISASFARGNMRETRERVSNATWITMIIAIPCALGLAFLAKPLTYLLFPQKGSLDQAALLLSILAITVIFYSASTVTNAALQAIGKMNMPLVSAGFALVIQTVVLVVLLFYTDLGIYALALVSVLYSVLIYIFNELFLHHYIAIRIDWMKVYVKPFLSALIMGIVAYLVYLLVSFLLGLTGALSEYMTNLISVLPALILAVLTYAYCLVRFHALSEEDLMEIPKGAMVVRIFRKLHWMK